MAYGNMTDAVSGQPASAAANNQIIDNVDDLDTRLDVTEALTTHTSGTVGTGNQRLSDRLGAGVTTASTAAAQLSALQTLTTDTATNGGQGNARLADRFGTGVGTGTNVTTGNAASQLADLRSRASALEAASGAGPLVRATRFSAAPVAMAQNVYTYIPWTAAPRNTSSMWSAGNPTRLTVPAGQGGLYNIEGILLVLPANTPSVAASTNKAVGIRVNGAGTIFRAGAPNLGVAGNYVEITLQMHMELAAADYIEIGVWHNFSPATDLTIGSDAGAPWVVMRKIA